MKRLLICLFVIFAVFGKAQLQLSFSGGPQLANDSLGFGKKIGVGFMATGWFAAEKKSSFGLSVGYIKHDREYALNYKQMIPFMLNYRYSFTQTKLRPYVSVGLGGVAYAHRYYWISHMGNVAYQLKKDLKGSAGVSAGVNWWLTKTFALNANIHYLQIVDFDSPVFNLGTNVGVAITIPTPDPAARPTRP